MPANHSQKAAVRQHMVATGQSYRAAAKAVAFARRLTDWGPAKPECPDRDHEWDCPVECSTRSTGAYRAWQKAFPEPEPVEPYVCPGPDSCEDLDCWNGCNFVFAALCSTCESVYGAGERCPQGCAGG
ncbi:hypothetical protein [Streptomyces sp. H27-C3]|uniref:hypothetical protein n=1 Tax=Streptomyces sp. H27-C3 TaxID=3046305 RepID=UPI0024BB3AEA|nr:hypothetical protein [Streptomyces sp. H27-C3]MDJ0465062.1 hypothetical protein [Streptomyces sp. H27-C3]